MGTITVHKQFLVLFLSVLVIGGCTGNTKTTAESVNMVRDTVFKVLGPGGGGGVMKPTISPFNENFVLTHCDMTGMYVTTNGGKTWKMKNIWNVPDDFEFDPADSNAVYVATRGFLYSEDRGSGISLLLRSDNKGESWRIIYPDVSKSKKVEKLQSTSLHPSEIIDGALDGTIQKVKVDPADNNRIYLGLAELIDYMGRDTKSADQGKATLILSADHGISWKTIARLPGKNVKAIFPESKKGLVTVFTESACVSINELTGEMKSMPLPVNSIIVVEGGKGKNGSLIYIQSDFRLVNGKVTGGVFVSSDMGATWTQRNEGLLKTTAKGRVPNFRQGFAVCESKPEVAYVSSVNPVANETGKPVTTYSVYKTINAGKSWEPVLLGSSQGYSTKNFNGSWMEESFGPGWGGSPIDMGVAPNNPDVCYAGDNGRGYKTMDGGKTWDQVYSHNNPDGSYSNNGLNVTTCYGVHFDPFDKNHFFICYTDIGLFHTFDGGKSWFHSINGIPGNWENTCYDLTFDPDVKGRVWSVWANAHDLPRTKMFGDNGFGSYNGGVAISDDYGRTWKKSNSGMSDNSVCTSILLDPSSSADSRILYVSLMDKGVCKSSDGGKTWKEANNGLGSNLFAWQLRRNSKNILYAIFARGLRKGETVDGFVYYSDNNADSWKQLQLPEGVNGPHDLLIDPARPKTMYLSCWPHAVNGKDQSGGVIKTVDGGKTWKQVFDERIRVNSAAMDPKKSSIIYINTFQNAAYRSVDSGTTWNRIEGYRFKWGQRVMPDVNNPGMLFLSTYGGSVFYGPAEGVPNAHDDIENMPEGWW